MLIKDEMTNKDVLLELANRIKQYRINMSISQSDLAKKSGVSLHTIINIENGLDCNFSKYIALLGALGLLSNLNLLVPAVQFSPVKNFDHTERKRVTKKKINRNWKWGDEE